MRSQNKPTNPRSRLAVAVLILAEISFLVSIIFGGLPLGMVDAQSISDPFADEADRSLVFGVEWNKITDTYTRLGAAVDTPFDDLYPYCDMGRVNLADDGTILAYYGQPGFADDGSNGQVMVRIPKFYYRTEVYETGYKWYITGLPREGFKIHPMFVRDGVIVEAVYVGAYKACCYDVSEGAYNLIDAPNIDFAPGTGDKMASIAGAKPISGYENDLTIANARRLANNRGPGWGLLDFHTVSMIQMLLLVEFATFNSQSVIGDGITGVSSGEGNMGMPTGQTADLGNASGSATGNIHPVTEQPANSVSYRGIENLWGNLWQFVDGINIRDRRVWIADHGFQSDLFGPPYEDSGYTLPDVNGYPRDIQSGNPDIDHAFLPSEVFPSGMGGPSSSHLYDYYHQSSGDRIAVLGGLWYHGSDAGAWCWRMSEPATYAGRSVGARLLFVGGPDESNAHEYIADAELTEDITDGKPLYVYGNGATAPSLNAAGHDIEVSAIFVGNGGSLVLGTSTVTNSGDLMVTASGSLDAAGSHYIQAADGTITLPAGQSLPKMTVASQGLSTKWSMQMTGAQPYNVTGLLPGKEYAYYEDDVLLRTYIADENGTMAMTAVGDGTLVSYEIRLIPVITPVPLDSSTHTRHEVDEGVTYRVQYLADQPVVWSIEGAPFLTIDENGVITGTPGITDSGQYLVTVTAFNGVGWSSVSFILVVNDSLKPVTDEISGMFGLAISLLVVISIVGALMSAIRKLKF